MATRSSKTSTVKAKPDKSDKDKTTAPRVSRARKPTPQDGTRDETQDQPSLTDPVAPRTTPAAIATRAFEKFCSRGYRHGHDVEDWLAAERELQS